MVFLASSLALTTLAGLFGLGQCLTQAETNGASTFGTLSNCGLSAYLSGPLDQGFPWGTATASNTNYYKWCPDTGVTRYYDFSITNMTLAPDGVSLPMLVVNGQFPGPLIEANWGDEIHVTVHNNLETEGTSIHWHGFLQTGTPWYDGVPGVSQCPIAPGTKFTYKFRAEIYGTSWWHSHYSAQMAAGLTGPIVIHGPTDQPYDIDIGPVMVTDFYHSYYYDLVEQTMANVDENMPLVTSNNTLINGKMNYNCSAAPELTCVPDAGLSKFQFQSGKKHLIRIINSGTEGLQKFSIDNHTMTVIANDFVAVEPYETNVVTLGVGQRSDVIVEGTGSSTDVVWMRSVLPTNCSSTDLISPEAFAIIYYEDADTSETPTTVTSVTEDQLQYCANDPLSGTQPYFPITPDPSPEFTETITVQVHGNVTSKTGWALWYMNNSTFYDDYNTPNLLEAVAGNLSFPINQNVYNFGSNATVRLILTSTLAIAHPMHIHGHNMYVLAEGVGTWDGTVVNAANPQRRDTQMMQSAGYIVIQLDMTNPGVWPFHCHIAWHVSGGLYINILEQPDTLETYNVPSVIEKKCKKWNSWTSDDTVDQIDSGL